MSDPNASVLPASTRVGPVRLQVSSLERSLAWYDRVLAPRHLDASPSRARLGIADGTLLVELVEVPGSRPVAPRTRLGLFHYALLLPDRPALGRFLRHLSALGEPVGAGDHLVSEALYLQDPDGLGIEVYADRPREGWAHGPGGELLMATDPVDVAALAAAAGGEPFRGLPAGTVMGHLHLHVGDLALAEAFYVDALGFEVRVRDYPGALFVAAGGYHHHLGLNTWARGAGPPGPGDARLLRWELHLPDPASVEAALERLEARGHPARRLDDGSVEVTDPWGTVLRLGAPAHGSRRP